MKTRRFRIALDFSQWDRLPVGSGHYRYCVGLINSLVEIQSEFDFIVVGSLAVPVPEIASIFESHKTQWHYRCLRPSHGRGYYYVDNFRYSSWLLFNRVDLYHQLGYYIPLLKPCRMIVTVFDFIAQATGDEGMTNTRPYRYYCWALRAWVDHVITISEATKSDLVRLHAVNPDKVSAIALGLSERFQMQVPVVDLGTQRFILAPYNLQPYKNLESLLRAMSTVLQVFPQIKLVLFGHAHITVNAEAQFESLCHELGLYDLVERTGYVSDVDLQKLYANAQVFVFPTLYEGFGYPLLEAMGCSAACIARNASAMAEVGGDAVMLVETSSSTEIAAGIVEILSNPDLQRRLRVAAKLRAERYSMRVMATEVLHCYTNVITA